MADTLWEDLGDAVEAKLDGLSEYKGSVRVQANFGCVLLLDAWQPEERSLKELVTAGDTGECGTSFLKDVVPHFASTISQQCDIKLPDATTRATYTFHLKSDKSFEDFCVRAETPISKTGCVASCVSAWTIPNSTTHPQDSNGHTLAARSLLPGSSR